jgi:NAD(P)-dependent dehydrogenase (short-subunit alcohol dehydrogenase family)
MDLKNKVAIITGGASGMGAATAERLAKLGARVILLDTQLEKAKAIASALQGMAVQCDVTNEESVASAIQAVIQQYQQLHIVVNCAGIVAGARVVGKRGPMPLEDFSRVIQINLIGTFNVIRLAAAQMMAQPTVDVDGERGVIINTASVAAFEGQVGQAAYSASKGGIVSMTLPLAREFGRLGIRVMAVAPGIIDTPMMSAMSETVKEGLLQSPIFPRRLGNAEEFANLIAHIVENSYLNGSVIRLDGAIRLPPS